MKSLKLSDEALETIIASLVMGVIIIAIFGLMAGWWNPFASSELDDEDERFNIAVFDSPTLGSRDAPVEIIEFSDFSCRACAQFAQEGKLQVLEYVEEGLVSFTFKHFPLTSIHPRALSVANAAMCANNQDAFWEFHDLVFEDISRQEVGDLQSFARELSLNMTEFNDCLISGQEIPRVELDIREGRQAGVRGTPTFFINGKRITGMLTSERVSEEVALALTQE